MAKRKKFVKKFVSAGKKLYQGLSKTASKVKIQYKSVDIFNDWNRRK